MADIDFGQISEALNDKSDRDLRNVDTTAKADAVIDFQVPTAENGYTWYRKYKSGWVEQGCNAGQTGTITLPVVMADSNYFISTRVYNGTNNVGWGEYGSDIARTTTTFRVGSLPSIWEVKGMTA